MRGVNHCFVGGNLGKDPEVKYLQSGVTVASFSLAISEKWKGKDGEMKEKTQWVTVVCFSKLAEIAANHLSKGDEVLVSGKISVRDWEDRDGNKKRAWEIVAREINFISLKKKVGEQEESRTDAGPDGDVPF